VAFMSFRLILGWMFLNIGLPTPKTTGVTKIRYSSIKPSRMKLDVRSALPNKAMSLPGCRVSRMISSAISLPTSRAFFHSTS
jgi:hypothetical protein